MKVVKRDGESIEFVFYKSMGCAKQYLQQKLSTSVSNICYFWKLYDDKLESAH